MIDNETVKALRESANNWVIQHNGVKEHSSGLVGAARDAADFIESLQTQLADKAELLDATIAGQETLQKALAESQARERAAAQLINAIDMALPGAYFEIKIEIRKWRGLQRHCCVRK